MAAEFPPRFCLLADNNKYVSRSPQPDATHGNYEAQRIGEVRDAPQVVFEVGSPHPDAVKYPTAVRLRHVETGKMAVQGIGVMRIFDDNVGEWDFYFVLTNADTRTNRATLFTTSRPKAGNNPSESVPDAHFIRFSRTDTNDPSFQNMMAVDWALPNGTPHTMFTVYDSALSKVWREVEFDYDKAILENIQPFSTSMFSFDNSLYDQTALLRPKLTFTESTDSNWSRSKAFGFSQSISVTAKIPFVAELEIGFTADQSFQIQEGGGFQTSVEHSVEVEVPVPPFRKMEIVVYGTRGKVTIPFRFKEVATYTDGTVRERILKDGLCTNVSSVEIGWQPRYTDADGRDIAPEDLGFAIPSGKFHIS